MAIIGIAGPSGAGKTTLARYLSAYYKDDFEHMRQDDYTKDPATFPMHGDYRNWEVPENYKFDMIASHLLELRQGREVAGKTFAKNETEPVYHYILQPKKFVLLEGSFVLTDEAVAALVDLKIYIDVPVEMMLARRQERMGSGYHRDYDLKVLVPSYKRFGEIQKIYADQIIDGTKSKKEVVEDVRALIAQKFRNQSNFNSYIDG
jgi:uridine kinase